MSYSYLLRALPVVLAVVASIKSQAQINNWTFNGPGFWDEAAKWELGLPGPSHDVQIGSDPYNFPGIVTTLRSGSFTIGSLSTSKEFVITGGSLSISSPVFSFIFAPFALQGGSINSASALNISGPMTWTGGSLGGSNAFNAQGGLTISGGPLSILGTASLRNNGVANWNSGSISLATGATLSNLNAGTFNIGGGLSLTGGTFSNAGTAIKTGAGTTTTLENTSFSNTGTLTVSSGTLEIKGITSFSSTGPMRVDGANALLQFSNSSLSAASLNNLATNNGGRIIYGGTLTLTGGWNCDAYGSGGFFLGGATLKDGNIVNSDKLKFVEGSTNTFESTTSDAGLSFTTPGTVMIRGAVSSGGPIMVGNGMTVRFAGVNGGFTTHSLTTNFVNHGTVEAIGVSGSLEIRSGRLYSNTGTIKANGGTLSLFGGSGSAIENTGSLVAENGGTLAILPNVSLGAAWTNNGSIVANGATSAIKMGGKVRIPNLGNFQLLNGAKAMISTGQLDNVNYTWDLAQYGAYGVWAVRDNARVIGGTIVNAHLLDLNHISNFEAVTLIGDVQLNKGHTRFIDGSKVVGSVFLNGGGQLSIDHTNTPTFVDYEVRFGDAPIQPSFPNILSLIGSNGAVLTITNGTVVHGAKALIHATHGKIINDGLISADAGNDKLTIQSKFFLNNGTIEAKNGTTLDINDFTTNFENLVGTTLTGGTFRVEANSLMMIHNADIVTNAANIELNGGNARFQNRTGSDALRNFATNSGSFIISGGRNFARSGDLTNSGTLTVGTGSTMDVNGYLQTAGTTTLDGTMDAAVSVNGGTLKGNGTIQGALTNGATVAPGASAGTLTVSSNYSQSPGGTLEIEVGGTSAGTFDKLVVNGAGTLGGTLHIKNISGGPIDPEAVLQIANFTSGLNGTFANVTWTGSQAWTVQYGPSGFQIKVAADQNVAPTSIGAIVGTHLNGGLSEVLTSDDTYFRVQNAFDAARNTPPIQIVAEATSPVAAPAGLGFTVEVGTSLSALTQKIELFNFVTGEYELVDTRPSSSPDATVTITASGNVSRFIDPATRAMRAKVLFVAGNDLSRQWNARIDYVSWRITP